MAEELTDRADRVYREAVNQAARFNHGEVRPEHVWLAATVVAKREIGKWGRSPREVRLAIEAQIISDNGHVTRLPPYSLESFALRGNAHAMAKANGLVEADLEHLLLAIVDAPTPAVASAAQSLFFPVSRLRESVWPMDLRETQAAVEAGEMPVAVLADWLEDRGNVLTPGVRWLADHGKRPREGGELWQWNHVFSPRVFASESILPYPSWEQLSDRYADHGLAVLAAGNSLLNSGRTVPG